MSQRKFKRAQQKAKSNKEEKKASENHQPSIQAMVWYREEHWEVLNNMFVDAEMLPKSYDDWLERAEEMEKKVTAAGDVVMKVYIDPETFPKWCEDKGMQMNAEARSQLAIEVAQAKSFSL